MHSSSEEVRNLQNSDSNFEQSPKSKRQQIGDELYGMFMDVFRDRLTLTIKKEDKTKGFTLRTKPQGSNLPDLLVLDWDVIGVTPEQMFYQIEFITEEQQKWNYMCKLCKVVKKEDDVEIIASKFKIPFL